jgi:riboflavin synthase
MFTGLVEEVGRVLTREPHEEGIRFRVACDLASELRAGESVSVSGVCQTVTVVEEAAFGFESIRTTLSRTTLGALEPGDGVNLERALRADARLGGHLVQGHVDGVGELVERREAGETWLLRIAMPEEIAAATVLHGSVAVDGVSLTVNALLGAVAEVAIIPYTWSHTTLSALEPGDGVNLEADLVGKYVLRLVAPYLESLSAKGRRIGGSGAPYDVDPSDIES